MCCRRHTDLHFIKKVFLKTRSTLVVRIYDEKIVVLTILRQTHDRCLVKGNDISVRQTINIRFIFFCNQNDWNKFYRTAIMRQMIFYPTTKDRCKKRINCVVQCCSITLRKGKTLRKHSLHGKTAA